MPKVLTGASSGELLFFWCRYGVGNDQNHDISKELIINFKEYYLEKAFLSILLDQKSEENDEQKERRKRKSVRQRILLPR